MADGLGGEARGPGRRPGASTRRDLRCGLSAMHTSEFLFDDSKHVGFAQGISNIYF